MPAWVWFSGAILLSIAEVLGGEFVLLMLGGAALVTAGAALFIPVLWIQLLIFAVVAIGLVLGARPPLLRHFKKDSGVRTGIEAVIGSPATVVSTVDADGGQVKIGGEVWSARAWPGTGHCRPALPSRWSRSVVPPPW